jgi:hypothetical protein
MEAARRAMAGPSGRVALRLAGLPAAAHRRRVVKLLLQNAVQAAGGQIFDIAGGEMLLLGAPQPLAEQTAAMLARLAASSSPTTELWQLPEEASRLLAWAEAAELQPASMPAPSARSLAGLDSLLARLQPEAVVRRQAILRLGAAMALPGRLLAISVAALAAELGPLAEDPDLRRHAEEVVASRLLPLLAAPGPLNPPGALLVPVPLDTLPGPAPRPGLVSVLPLQAAAGPDALAARRATLAERGWGLAVAGLDAAALRLVALDAIPADWLLLNWSPGLPRAAERLAPMVAGRCLLLDCDGPEALGWGKAHGVQRFAGPHVEAVLATARLASCREAGGCTQRQCVERAAATAVMTRAGCRNLALLDAAPPLDEAA